MIDIVGYFREIGTGIQSLATGMAVTFRCMFRKPVTVPYPHRTLRMTPRFRGPIELVRDAEGRPTCVVCLMCQRICPSRSITVEGEKPPGGKERVPTRFTLDFTTCSLCGLCVEHCRFDAIRHSRVYQLADTRREAFLMDLLKVRPGVQPEGGQR